MGSYFKTLVKSKLRQTSYKTYYFIITWLHIDKIICYDLNASKEMLVKIVGSGAPELRNTELIDEYKIAKLTGLKQGQSSVPSLAELPTSHSPFP